MCGIAGMLGWNPQFQDTELAVQMLSIQRYRGPNDEGLIGYSVAKRRTFVLPYQEFTHLQEPVDGLMGFVRLSIRDLSVNGHQPMLAADGQVVLTFNGEIYNADELKADLIVRGYTFASTTDTEVILKSYLEYGFDQTIRRLNGMFAIALLDLRQDVAYLARDRAGIKPLYYYRHQGTVYYSSELKGLLQCPGFHPEVDMNSLGEKLLYRGATHASLLRGIEQIMPGEYLVLPRNGAPKSVRYFSINDYTRPERGSGSYIQRKERFEKVLSKSVKRQMVSDVKVGCQLSGGVDSSLVCWYARKENPFGMNDTISIVSPNPAFSEEAYIDKVNFDLNLTPHKYLLDPDKVFATIDEVIWHTETMLTQPSALGLYQLAKHAKEHVTVLLSGEGSDELQGGYECWYRPLTKIWKEQPHAKDIDYFEKYVVSMDVDSSPKLMKTLIPSFDEEAIKQERMDIFHRQSGDPLTRVMKYQFETYLPELLLRQDKMSMAHSIENRVPLLDNEVIEYAYSLPLRDLLHDKISHINKKALLRGRWDAEYQVDCKYILKEICAEKYGHKFAYREKQGFPMPIVDFMYADLFKQRFYDELLPSAQARGIVDADALKHLYEKSHLDYYEGETLWRVLTFEIWCEKFIDA